MTFELPEKPGCTSLELRDLEQNAPNVTPKAIRSALMRAAQQIEKMEQSRDMALMVLEEAASIKPSAMDSESRAYALGTLITGAIKSAVVSLRG